MLRADSNKGCSIEQTPSSQVKISSIKFKNNLSNKDDPPHMFLFIGVPRKFGFEKTAQNAKNGDIVSKGEPVKVGQAISGNQV